MNVIAVPLLALAHRWEVAGLLILMERCGKALRTPGRDALVSYAAHQVGRGMGFGVHEAMDRIGGLLGPIVILLVGLAGESYRLAFALLGIPALLSLWMLALVRRRFPHPQELEPLHKSIRGDPFPLHFWLYMGAISCIALGFINYPLISYFFMQKTPAYWIPLLYAFAVIISAMASLLLGKLFDRWGMKIVLAATFISSFFVLFVFTSSLPSIVFGMVLWGIGWGSQGSILRAAVARWVIQERRATAYGILNFSLGIFSFLGSSLVGFLLDRSLFFAILFSLVAQFIALPLLFLVQRYERSHS
jgi:MFS family permease